MTHAGQSVYWPRILAEGTAIVVSILLAFAIDAWWDGRQRRAAEEQVLVGLYQEVLANRDLLEEQTRTIELAQERLTRFVGLTTEQARAPVGDSLWAAVYSPLIRSYTATLTTGALDATISSGDLALIRNAELRTALARIGALDQNVAELRVMLSQLSAQAALKLVQYPWMAEAVAARRELALPDNALRLLNADDELRAYAAEKIRLWAGHNGEVAQLAGHLEEVATIIEAELGEHGDMGESR